MIVSGLDKWNCWTGFLWALKMAAQAIRQSRELRSRFCFSYVIKRDSRGGGKHRETLQFVMFAVPTTSSKTNFTFFFGFDCMQISSQLRGMCVGCSRSPRVHFASSKRDSCNTFGHSQAQDFVRKLSSQHKKKSRKLLDEVCRRSIAELQ